MPTSIAMIVISSHLVVAVADTVPNFDIGRNCKLDVTATAGLSVGQPLKNCIRDEQRARRQLASQWSKFPAASRASCVADEDIAPSYVSLLTCLQINQWSR
jgi:hypothetical protein